MIVILLVLACGIDAPLNEKVLEFARSNVGQQVGNGECSTLAAEALSYAGARRRRGGHSSWGDELKSLRDAQAGDIAQFEKAVFINTQIRDDGGVITETREFPHHTAVIARVRKARQEADPGHPAPKRGRQPDRPGMDDRPGPDEARKHQDLPARGGLMTVRRWLEPTHEGDKI